MVPSAFTVHMSFMNYKVRDAPTLHHPDTGGIQQLELVPDSKQSSYACSVRILLYFMCQTFLI